MAGMIPGCLPGLCGLDPVVAWLSGPGFEEKPRGTHPRPGVVSLFYPGHALGFAAILYQYRREEQAAQGAEQRQPLTLSTDQGLHSGWRLGRSVRGWALAEQGQKKRGLCRCARVWPPATGAKEIKQSYFLALLAEAYEKGGQREEGLRVLAEALAM